MLLGKGVPNFMYTISIKRPQKGATPDFSPLDLLPINYTCRKPHFGFFIPSKLPYNSEIDARAINLVFRLFTFQ